MPQQSTDGVVMRNGLIFGAIIAALPIISAVITGEAFIRSLPSEFTSQANGSVTSAGLSSSGVSALQGCVFFLTALALTFVAGMLTARRTGGVGAGSLAGLMAGSFGVLLGGAVSLVVVITLIAPTIQAPDGVAFVQSQMQGALFGVEIFALILEFFAYGVFGAGMGALGGLVGARSYPKANPPAARYPGLAGSLATPTHPQEPQPPQQG